MASTTTETQKPDPALLGVQVPLSVTLSAAKQVGAAWQRFGIDLVHAVQQKREGAKAASTAKPKSKEVSESSASPAASA